MNCSRAMDKAVGRVCGKQRVLHAQHLAGAFGGDLRRPGLRSVRRGSPRSRRPGAPRRCAAASASQLMRAMTARSLFHDYQDAAHRTRTSNLSFSTSAAAASLAVPVSICVDFCLLGRRSRSSTTTGAESAPSSAAATCAHFLGFGALDAHQRGVAQLVAAGLDGEDRGGGQFDVLEPAFLQLAL